MQSEDDKGAKDDREDGGVRKVGMEIVYGEGGRQSKTSRLQKVRAGMETIGCRQAG